MYYVEELCTDLDEEEVGAGMYRDTAQHTTPLARFFERVYESRED